MELKRLMIFILILINFLCTQKYLLPSDKNCKSNSEFNSKNDHANYYCNYRAIEEQVSQNLEAIRNLYNNQYFNQANNLCSVTCKLIESTNIGTEHQDFIDIVSLYCSAQIYYKNSNFLKCGEILDIINKFMTQTTNINFRNYLLEILKK